MWNEAACSAIFSQENGSSRKCPSACNKLAMFPAHPSSTSARVEEPTGKTKALRGSKVSKSENYCARPTRARATPSPSSACAHTAWADALCCFPSPTRWAAAQTWARRALLGLTPPDPTRSLCPGTQVLKCLLLTRGSGSPPWKASSMNSVSAPCPPPPRWAVPCPSRGQSCQPIRPTLQRGRAKGLPPGIGGQAGTPSLETFPGASARPTGPTWAQPLHHRAPSVHSLCPPAWEPLSWPGP